MVIVRRGVETFELLSRSHQIVRCRPGLRTFDLLMLIWRRLFAAPVDGWSTFMSSRLLGHGGPAVAAIVWDKIERERD
jgi:hypothetical protein